MDSPSLISYIRMGINTAGSWMKKVLYYLFNKVKIQGFLATNTGSLSDDNAWTIDSGASRHMTGESKQLHTLSKEPSSHAVELGDNKSYAIRGLGSTSLKLDNGSKQHLNNILYVPGLKKNLLSISCLKDKREKIAFVDRKVLVSGKTLALIKLGLLEFVKEVFIGSLHHLKLWFIWK